METQSGFLLINKPKGITSFAAVKHIRKLTGRKIRVGHSGTLDPFATGLLIIAIDRSATKHLDSLLTLDKTYRATGKLGELTDTLDVTGTLVREETIAISRKQLEMALDSFGTSYVQTAPIYSALKYKGTRLYDLARSKQLSPEKLAEIANTKQREVSLYRLTLVAYDPPYFIIEAQVSRGTYIRTLINDIAERAGSCATTYDLERTAIGPFTLAQAQSLSSFTTDEDISRYILPIETVLDEIKAYHQSDRKILV